MIIILISLLQTVIIMIKMNEIRWCHRNLVGYYII